jgi:hypothetical protein
LAAVFFPSTAALTPRLLCWRGFLSGGQAPSLICLWRRRAVAAPTLPRLSH